MYQVMKPGRSAVTVAAAAVIVAAVTRLVWGVELCSAYGCSFAADTGVADVYLSEYYIRNSLFTATWYEYYANTWTQTGVLYGLLVGALTSLSGAVFHAAGWTAVTGLWWVIGFGAVLLVLTGQVWLTRFVYRAGFNSSRWQAAVFVVVFSGLLGLGRTVYEWGHWGQMFVVFGWVAGSVLLLNHHVTASTAMFAVTVGWEPWAVLGVAVCATLFGGSLPVKLWTATAGVAGGVLVWWVPFAVLGDFRVGEKTWNVNPGSMWFFITSNFPWWLRGVQTVLVVAGVLGAVWFSSRGTSAGAFFRGAFHQRGEALPAPPPVVYVYAVLTPALIVAFRVAFDTIYYPYYLTPVAVLLVPVVAVTLLSGDVRASAWLFVGIICVQFSSWNWSASRCAGNDTYRPYCEGVTPSQVVDVLVMSPAYLLAFVASISVMFALRTVSLPDGRMEAGRETGA